MPIYEYKALNEAGKSVSEMIDADSPRALRDQLKRNGQFLTRYTETKRGGGNVAAGRAMRPTTRARPTRRKGPISRKPN